MQSHWDPPRIWDVGPGEDAQGCQSRDVAPCWGTSRGQQHCTSTLRWARRSLVPPTTIICIREHHGLTQQQLISSHLAEEAAP